MDATAAASGCRLRRDVEDWRDLREATLLAPRLPRRLLGSSTTISMGNALSSCKPMFSRRFFCVFECRYPNRKNTATACTGSTRKNLIASPIICALPQLRAMQGQRVGSGMQEGRRQGRGDVPITQILGERPSVENRSEQTPTDVQDAQGMDVPRRAWVQTRDVIVELEHHNGLGEATQI